MERFFSDGFSQDTKQQERVTPTGIAETVRI